MFFVRLGSLRGIGVLLTATIALTACGGGSHAIPAAAGGSPSSPGQTAPATFIISVPQQQGSIASDKRSPRYITSATKSIRVNVTQVNGSAVAFTPVVVNVASCPTDPGNSSNFQCTVNAAVPLGSDTLSIGTYDQPNAAGNLISQQFTTVTVKQGVANGPPTAGYTFTLDANPKTITVAPPGTGAVCPHNPVQAADSCTVNGTSPLAFTVTVSDAHGTIIANNSIPGSPALSATSGTGSVASVSTTQNPYAVSITPTGTSGSSLITVTANPSTATSQLASTQFQFTVQTVPSLLALGQANATQGQINVYTLGASAFTSYGVIPPSVLGTYAPAEVGFDTANDLYMFDNNNNAILRFPSNQLSLSSGETFTAITNGITGMNGLYSTFSLAPDGTMAVGNEAAPSTLNQLVVYTPGATSPSLTRAFGGPQAGYFYRAGASAVLTNASGLAFAYAVALEADNGTVSSNTTASAFGTGKIGIIATSPGTISGSSAVSCSVTCYEFDLMNEAGGPIGALNILPLGLVWNNHNQELVFFDNTAGTVTTYPFTGTSFGAPVQLGTYVSTNTSSVPASYAVSRDGHLAYSWGDINGNTFVTVLDSSHAPVAAWNAKQFAWNGSAGFAVSGLAFLPNDDLLVAGGYSQNQLFAYTLTNSSTPVATTSVTLAGGTTSGIGSSGQSVHRRPLGVRRPGLLRIP